MAFQGRPLATAGAPAAMLRVKFWPEHSKWTIRGVARAATHSRCNSPSPRSFLRLTNKLRELLQKFARRLPVMR